MTNIEELKDRDGKTFDSKIELTKTKLLLVDRDTEEYRELYQELQSLELVKIIAVKYATKYLNYELEI